MSEVQQGDNNQSEPPAKPLGRYLAEFFGLACTHPRFWNEKQELADDGSPVVSGACKDCGEAVTRVFSRDIAPE